MPTRREVLTGACRWTALAGLGWLAARLLDHEDPLCPEGGACEQCHLAARCELFQGVTTEQRRG